MEMRRIAKSTSAAVLKPTVPGICLRLANAREATRYTQEAVAEAMGVTRVAYSKWETRTPMPTETIPAAAKFLNVSATWLAWGADMPVPRSLKSRVEDPATDAIAQIEVRVGFGEGEAEVVEIPAAQWATPARFFGHPDALMIVDSKGDSMEPTLLAGDRVVVDHSDQNPSQGGIYALWDGHGLRVKRVENIAQSKPWKIQVISENPIYPPDEMEVNEGTIVGRVVGIIRRLR